MFALPDRPTRATGTRKLEQLAMGAVAKPRPACRRFNLSDHPEMMPGLQSAPDRATTHLPVARPQGPGFILMVLAALCAVIVMIPTFVIAAVMIRRELNPLEIIMQFHDGLPGFVLLLLLPSALLMAMSSVFVLAFVLRASWGPIVVSGLALAWVVSGAFAGLALPNGAFGSGLTGHTFLGTISSLLAPFVLVIGFVGFLMNGERPKAWFSRRGRTPA